MRTNRKRLAVDIPIGIHQQIKIVAAAHNCTITKWIMKAILTKLKVEFSLKMKGDNDNPH